MESPNYHVQTQLTEGIQKAENLLEDFTAEVIERVHSELNRAAQQAMENLEQRLYPRIQEIDENIPLITKQIITDELAIMELHWQEKFQETQNSTNTSIDDLNTTVDRNRAYYEEKVKLQERNLKILTTSMLIMSIPALGGVILGILAFWLR